MIKKIKKGLQKKHFMMVGALNSVPFSCFAGATATPSSILQNIIDYLTGDLARVIGVAVVVGAGYMFLSAQAIQKSTFIKLMIGMGLILGAPTLAAMWWG